MAFCNFLDFCYATLRYIMLCERVTYQFQWFSISLPVVLLRGQERNPIMAKSNSRKGFLLTKQHRLGWTERHLVQLFVTGRWRH